MDENGELVLRHAQALSCLLGKRALGYARLEAIGGAFVGIERMKLFGPVKVNDTIQVDIEVLDTKAVPARGGGIVRYRQWVKNQRGETVMEYDVARLIRAGQEKQ